MCIPTTKQMWSPLNIAMVDLDVSASQDEDDQASPVSHHQLLCTPREEIDDHDDDDLASQEEDDQASSTSHHQLLCIPCKGVDESGGGVPASQEEDDQGSPASQQSCTPRKDIDDDNTNDDQASHQVLCTPRKGIDGIDSSGVPASQ
ncbi:unnamed protein product, partial [Laminaria digitata]